MMISQIRIKYFIKKTIAVIHMTNKNKTLPSLGSTTKTCINNPLTQTIASCF